LLFLLFLVENLPVTNSRLQEEAPQTFSKVLHWLVSEEGKRKSEKMMFIEKDLGIPRVG
jgi:maltose-binding protein MalE